MTLPVGEVPGYKPQPFRQVVVGPADASAADRLAGLLGSEP